MHKEPKKHCTNIELPPGAPQRELNIYIRSKHKNLTCKADIACRLLKFFVIAMYILSSFQRAPGGSNVCTMGFRLLMHSGALKKNFRRLQAIFALQVRFLCLLPMYILSSLQGAPGGSSVFGKRDIGSPHIQELSQKNSEAYKQYLLCKLDFCVCSLCIY